MAFATTNTGKFLQPPGEYVPSAQNKFADVSAPTTTSAFNTGISSLFFARVIVKVKAYGTLVAGDSLTVNLQVGTGTAVTNPVNVGTYVYTMATGDTAASFVFYCWSDTAFQSYKVATTSTSSHTATLDIQVDCC